MALKLAITTSNLVFEEEWRLMTPEERAPFLANRVVIFVLNEANRAADIENYGAPYHLINDMVSDATDIVSRRFYIGPAYHSHIKPIYFESEADMVAVKLKFDGMTG